MRYIEEFIREFGDEYIRLRMKVEDDIVRKRSDGWTLIHINYNGGGFHGNYCIEYGMFKWENID